MGAAVGVATLALLVILFPTPVDSRVDVLGGEHLGADSLRRVFGSPTLWTMGLAFLGAYGSYFGAVQLLPHYAQTTLNLDAGTAEGISVILLVSGIPGAFIGGWLADRVAGIVPTFLVACSLEAAALVLVPYLGLLGVEIAAATIGAATITAFVVWITIPGQHSDEFRVSDVPTAAGLMLTIVAVGGAVVPPLYGQIAATWGFAAAWGFEGVVTVGFAMSAGLALSRRPANVAVPLSGGK